MTRIIVLLLSTLTAAIALVYISDSEPHPARPTYSGSTYLLECQCGSLSGLLRRGAYTRLMNKHPEQQWVRELLDADIENVRFFADSSSSPVETKTTEGGAVEVRIKFSELIGFKQDRSFYCQASPETLIIYEIGILYSSDQRDNIDVAISDAIKLKEACRRRD